MVLGFSEKPGITNEVVYSIRTYKSSTNGYSHLRRPHKLDQNGQNDQMEQNGSKRSNWDQNILLARAEFDRADQILRHRALFA